MAVCWTWLCSAAFKRRVLFTRQCSIVALLCTFFTGCQRASPTAFITHFPQDVIVNSGSDAVFECNSSSSFLDWNFVPYYSQAKPVQVSDGGAISEAFHGKVDLFENQLVVRNANAANAGTYTCIANGFDERASAQLTVIDSETKLTCYTNFDNKTCLLGRDDCSARIQNTEMVNLTCSFNYWGKLGFTRWSSDEMVVKIEQSPNELNCHDLRNSEMKGSFHLSISVDKVINGTQFTFETPGFNWTFPRIVICGVDCSNRITPPSHPYQRLDNFLNCESYWMWIMFLIALAIPSVVLNIVLLYICCCREGRMRRLVECEIGKPSNGRPRDTELQHVLPQDGGPQKGGKQNGGPRSETDEYPSGIDDQLLPRFGMKRKDQLSTNNMKHAETTRLGQSTLRQRIPHGLKTKDDHLSRSGQGSSSTNVDKDFEKESEYSKFGSNINDTHKYKERHKFNNKDSDDDDDSYGDDDNAGGNKCHNSVKIESHDDSVVREPADDRMNLENVQMSRFPPICFPNQVGENGVLPVEVGEIIYMKAAKLMLCRTSTISEAEVYITLTSVCKYWYQIVCSRKWFSRCLNEYLFKTAQPRRVGQLDANGRLIIGVAELNDRFYVICDKEDYLLAYESHPPFAKIKSEELCITVMKDPCGLASCNVNDCLYVIDRGHHCVWLVKHGTVCR